jgi:predicted Zn-dependent peptidase
VKNRSRKDLLPVLIVALAGCAEMPTPVPSAPDPPGEVAVTGDKKNPAAPSAEDPAFRKAPPASSGEVTFVPPKIQEARLSNGVRILLVERHDMPIVAVNIVSDRGAEVQGRPGLAGMTAAMLLAGTKTRSALALSDELGAIGAAYGSYADHDGMGVSGQALRDKASALFTILADVVQNPAFDAAELERERSRRLTAIAQQNDVPAVLLGNAISEKLYPAGHPYREPLIGNEASVKAMKPAELSRFYASAMRPDRTTVAIAGDIDKASATALVEKSFGAWGGKAGPAGTLKDPAAIGKDEKRLLVVDRPRATQSIVAVTAVGVPRKHPDYDAIQLMNTLLGGQFSSRLNLNLREKNAYTYGARSGFDMRHGAGPFTAGGAIMAQATAPAIKEIFAEIERMRKEPPSADELSDAKANLVRQLPARFETAGDTASTLAALAVMDLPLDEFATRPARIAKVTAEDVRRVAEKYLRPEQMRVILVGDAEVIEKDLATLGIGEAEIRRAPQKAKKEAEKPAGKAAQPAGKGKGKMERLGF